MPGEDDRLFDRVADLSDEDDGDAPNGVSAKRVQFNKGGEENGAKPWDNDSGSDDGGDDDENDDMSLNNLARMLRDKLHTENELGKQIDEPEEEPEEEDEMTLNNLAKLLRDKQEKEKADEIEIQQRAAAMVSGGEGAEHLPPVPGALAPRASNDDENWLMPTEVAVKGNRDTKSLLLFAMSLFASSFELNALATVVHMPKEVVYIEMRQFDRDLLVYDVVEDRYCLQAGVREQLLNERQRKPGGPECPEDDECKLRYIHYYVKHYLDIAQTFETVMEMEEGESYKKIKNLLLDELDNFEEMMVLAISEVREYASLIESTLEKTRSMLQHAVDAARRVQLMDRVLSAMVERRHSEDELGDEMMMLPINVVPSTPRTSKSNACKLEMTFLTELGKAHMDMKAYDKSETSLTQARDVWEKTKKDDEGALSLILCHLGTLYMIRERTDEAEAMFSQALKIRSNMPDRSSKEEYADVLFSLASVLEKLGRYREAEPLVKQAYDVYIEVLGMNNFKVALTVNNRAAICLKLGNVEDAEDYFLHSMTIRERLYGPSHPSVGSIMKSLGVLYNNQKQFDKAQEYLTKAQEIFETHFGAEDIGVAQCLNNKAFSFQKQDMLDEAEEHYTRALKISQNVLGMNHPFVAQIFSNLASVHWNRGEYQRAESLYEMSLSIRKLALGATHPDVAKSLYNLAVLYSDWGMFDRAILLYEQCLKIQESTYGPEHHAVLATKENMKLAYEMAKTTQPSKSCTIL